MKELRDLKDLTTHDAKPRIVISGGTTLWEYNPVYDDCVKSLRSSYTGLYPQKPGVLRMAYCMMLWSIHVWVSHEMSFSTQVMSRDAFRS